MGSASSSDTANNESLMCRYFKMGCKDNSPAASSTTGAASPTTGAASPTTGGAKKRKRTPKKPSKKGRGKTARKKP